MSSTEHQSHMFSYYHKDWALNMKKLIDNHNKILKKYENTSEVIDTEILHKKRMKSFRNARKLFLFINRTKLQYFSFQPRILKFWRTITRKRNEFMKDIDEKLTDKKYNEKEHHYLKLFKKTLEKYDPTYGLQVGLLLHVKFSKDIALFICDYLM